jgi:hypothetical protein
MTWQYFAHAIEATMLASYRLGFHGLIWMIDSSIGLGTGKILAVLAVDAHHHQRAPDALALHDVHALQCSR